MNYASGGLRIAVEMKFHPWKDGARVAPCSPHNHNVLKEINQRGFTVECLGQHGAGAHVQEADFSGKFSRQLYQ